MNRFPIAIVLAVVPAVGSAHHSFAATFEVETIEEVTGELTEIQWRNPHVLFVLRADDGTEYDIESHSMSIIRRMEIDQTAMQVGDVVTVAGHPSRRDETGMFVLNVMLSDGQEVVFDPFGAPRWTGEESMGSHDVWQATGGQAQDGGIFRVWSTAVTHPNAWPFPEMFDPGLMSQYPLTAEAQAAIESFDPFTDLPTANCAAKGMPTIMEQPYPMEIVDQGDTILLRLEEYDTLRTVHMNVTAPPADQPYTDLGFSVGRWEGDVLVVETTNVSWPFFNSVGIPLSEAVHIVEHFILSEDGSELDLRITVTDPATFNEPVEVGKTFLALPGIEVQPYDCVR